LHRAPSTDLQDAQSNISGYGMTKADPEREARLAAALRENLRRRKAQCRDPSNPTELNRDAEDPGDDARDAPAAPV